MYLEGGASAPVYTSGSTYGTSYDDGYSVAYSRSGMSYDDARRQAWFLSDKMAYELGLSDAQFNAIYEINLDYLLSMRGERSIYGNYWTRRNTDIFYVLNASQYNYFVSLDYFYRPVYWYNNAYSFGVYRHYGNPRHYYRARPTYYSSYRGGRNRQRKSYYAGRFGERTGRPIVTNRSGYRGNNGYNGVAKTPKNGNNAGRATFGNQKRDSFNNNGAKFGNQNRNSNTNKGFSFGNRNRNNNTNTTPVGPRPNVQPGNATGRFGGSRNGNVNRPAVTPQPKSGTTRPINTTTNRRSFGAGRDRTITTQKTQSVSNSTGTSTTRVATPQPNRTQPKKNGNFGGHR